MGKLYNFSEFKKLKEAGDSYEKDYLQFLSLANQLLGLPKNFNCIVKCLYVALRYLEGTVNGLLIISAILPFDKKQVEEVKSMLINWLQDIIDRVREL